MSRRLWPSSISLQTFASKSLGFSTDFERKENVSIRVMGGLTTASGVLGLLYEPDPELQIFALRRLNAEIDTLWTEVVEVIGQVESLYEDANFPERQLAALVAAKVFYHLQEYEESMTFALGAGSSFDIDQHGDFEETVLAKCIDTYIATSASPPSLTKTSSGTLDSSFATTNGATTTAASLASPSMPFSQATLPSKSLLSRQDSAGLEPDSQTSRGILKPLNQIIDRVFTRCLRDKQYRQVVGIAVEARKFDVLRHTISLARKDVIDGKNHAPQNAESLLHYLLVICMETVQERAFRQQLLRLILDLLNHVPSRDVFSIARCLVYLDEANLAAELLGDLKNPAEAYQVAFDLYNNSSQDFLRRVQNGLDEKGSRDKMLDILNGTTSIGLFAEFLFRHNHADKHILTKLKDSLEARNSIFHTAVTLSCGYMNAGTLNDSFYRENLEWLGKAVNWSKFTATASLGVIHRGNLSSGQRILLPYLPKENSSTPSSVYSQGGALYAVGLIYANHKANALDDIWNHFKKATEEVIQHGGALGLGLAGMATADENIYEDLKQVLWSDSALCGEAVGTAMGLIMLGSGNIKALEDMIQYAHDTQHEKIVRGLGLGMALIMYGRQEGADELVNGLLEDTDPILRYGGVQTLALAYCGTGSNKAVRKLLHIAVSDVNDDVRRYAVMSLGFILFRKPKSVPRMVELLAESYNPHVRYGAAMALGISCAGTGLDEAIDLLEPMVKDTTDFVRQGALLAMSMILVQQNEALNPKVGEIRKLLQKAVTDRHEDAMTKFGSAIALGIVDAGGRNCTISLQTQTGNLNMAGIVGMMVFTQYWYWFPLAHFLSLSFAPTSVIALDPDLEVPDLQYYSATRPSLFEYLPEQEVKADDAPEKVKTAVLSTTEQAKRRAQKKKLDSMDVDEKQETDKPDVETSEAKATVDEKEKEEAEKEDKSTREKVGYRLENMSRVMPAQMKHISFPDSRYRPVKTPTGGVILMEDMEPKEPKKLLQMKRKMPSKKSEERPPADVAMTTEEEGAAAAAVVLTSVDEGESDAEVPEPFDYESDEEEL